jgi:hypothetical protein
MCDTNNVILTEKNYFTALRIFFNNTFRIKHKTNLDNLYQGSDPKVNTDAKKGHYYRGY